MRTKTSLTREVLLGTALSALVLLCAWAWGSPFVATPGSGASMQAQSHPQTRSFTGIIERNGVQLFLREVNGPTYRVANPKGDAQGLVGKPATVLGKLDATSGTIHVERVAPARE
jgi:hypothetical protein